MSWVRNRDGAPRLDVERTDYGYTYVSTRNLGDDGAYVRVYHYVMPAQQMRGGVTSWTGVGKADVPRLDGHVWVPIDDDHTMVWNRSGATTRTSRSRPSGMRKTKRAGAAVPTISFRARSSSRRTTPNDYLIDRQMQKTKNFTGIVGINTQDYALQEGMGPIGDRSKNISARPTRRSSRAASSCSKRWRRSRRAGRRAASTRPATNSCGRTMRSFRRVKPGRSSSRRS